MRLSIIVPVLNEAKTIGQTLDHLSGFKPNEIIVVDGGSCDGTLEIARTFPCVVSVSCQGRARQMNHGARLAAGDVLLFLHADTRLPATAERDIANCLQDPGCVGGRFDVELEADRWLLGLVGRLISLRSRITRISTGDQAMFVRRSVFETLGGFPEIPLMEDVAFSRMLKRAGSIACLESTVVTSARRWEKHGPLRTIFLMWTLKCLFLAGVSPHLLAKLYANTR
jgi:rSAM/selenodomain-associated transferase 2